MILMYSFNKTAAVDGWEQKKGFKCYWIKKQIEPFCIHPSSCIEYMVSGWDILYNTWTLADSPYKPSVYYTCLYK